MICVKEKRKKNLKNFNVIKEFIKNLIIETYNIYFIDKISF